MALDRREFLAVAGAAVATLSRRATAHEPVPARIKAVVFDAFPIFDPRPVGALVEALVPESGKALYELWRTRLFEYQWLRALAQRYADFHTALGESLDLAAAALKLRLAADVHAQLVAAYSNLKAWPDVAPALDALAQRGLRLTFLSNMTEPMLHDNLRSAGLAQRFERALSTDRVRSYKPDPRAYALACEHLRLAPGEIVFVPFAGWDMAGAKWFGFPTFWVNRLGAPAEFGVAPDGEGRTLDDLVRFLHG